ncbi:hypothetical protein DP113_34345 (plasmid) [Brasilonema octagenarum UFV-E1]|uniref:Uncharacterized protein n=2 Tax=Brasilonema TaxID=383614 RepID=A0A856MT21_9CYAN|nr:hypothetical protein [Brasilonema octagenarum UFV-OR1]QDL12801.1 hypothetical protein DP114_34240 [Brasilonema sennae CENA114]QDL19197.1 hypothetical protein DP113_34345 [Brasilonema octagenarum UFV-E1]
MRVEIGQDAYNFTKPLALAGRLRQRGREQLMWERLTVIKNARCGFKAALKKRMFLQLYKDLEGKLLSLTSIAPIEET